MEKTIPWHEVKDNLLVLLDYMAEHHYERSEMVRAVEKPWTYEDLYRLALCALIEDNPDDSEDWRKMLAALPLVEDSDG